MERLFFGGLALAAAMILRLDAGLAAASFGLVLWLFRRRFPGQYVIAGLAPLGLWLAGLYSRFGTMIPTTLMAKRSEYSAATAAYSLAEWRWLRRSLPLSGCFVLLVLAVLGASFCLKRGLWKHPAVLAVVFWLVAHEVFYRAVRVPFAPWYHEGLVNAVLALAAFGAAEVSRGVLRWRQQAATPLSALLAVVMFVPVFLPAASYVRTQWRRPPDPRFEIYRAIGLHLAEHARREATVVAVEVGIIGYFSRCSMLDLMGIVTPEILDARSRGSLAQLLRAARPDYVVDAPEFRIGDRPLLSELDIQEPYSVAYEFVSSGGAPYRLLRRGPTTP